VSVALMALTALLLLSQTCITYGIMQGLMAFFLYYILLFGLYQSATTTVNLVASWALNQARVAL